MFTDSILHLWKHNIKTTISHQAYLKGTWAANRYLDMDQRPLIGRHHTSSVISHCLLSLRPGNEIFLPTTILFTHLNGIEKTALKETIAEGWFNVMDWGNSIKSCTFVLLGMFIHSHSRSICFWAPVRSVWVPVKHLYAYYGVNIAKNAMVYLETGPFNLNQKMSVGDGT